MTIRTAPALAVVSLLIAACAACSSSTDGKADLTPAPGSAAVTAPSSGESAPDFPASAASAPGEPGSASTAAPTAPGSGPVSDTSGAGTGGVTPAPAKPLRTVTTRSADGTSFYVKVWAERHDASCSDHAYGKPMIAFLTSHPCHGMDRELATTVVGGRQVGMSIITTNFPGTQSDPYAGSRGFRNLVVKDGTGSINDLLREGYRLPSGPTSVPSPDAFNALGQDNGVNVYDVWYLNGPTPNNDRALVDMTEDIFLQV